MQADFVAIQFRRFEQSRNIDQRIQGTHARLNGKQRGLERVFGNDRFGGSEREGIKQAGVIAGSRSVWFKRSEETLRR